MRHSPRLAALLVLSVAACPSKPTKVEEPKPLPTTPDAGAGGGPSEPPDDAVAPEQQFQSWCRGQIAAADERLKAILAVTGPRTEANTLVPYNQLSIALDDGASKASLFSEVHPAEKMRTSAEECMREVMKYMTDLSLNRALYDAFAAVDATGFDAPTQRLVERTLRDFRRAGVDKDEATRERLRALSEKEVELGQIFDRNIRDDVRKVKLDPKQLAGLPEDWIAAHPVDADGKVTVTTDYPDYIPFRTYAQDGEARLALFKEFMNRGWPKNDEVFKELLAVRKEKAKLLGYADWADYITEDKMVRSGKQVRSFIDKVAKVADKRAKRDYKALLARKKQDDKKAKSVGLWENLYYEELIKKEQYQLDSQEVRQYFDFPQVKAGLLQVTSKIFQVEYRQVKGADVWHADVDVYDVHRAGSGEKLGRIYLDLHPREGKYKHAAQFTLMRGVDGVRLPEGVLVCNFATGLMEHNDVETFFHEFGHLMHHVLGGDQKWVYFSGVATEWDFVEAPSQMLEEWAWDAETLALFAKHKETQQPIPADLVKRMRAANEFGKGTFARTQMFYASLSLRYHQLPDPAKIDSTQIVVEEQKKYSMFPYVPETHFQANFGHLNGYSAMYYTYMWSLVIAKDMFSEFKKNGMLDEETARRYTESVLVPGGSRDAADLVKAFLGREYSFESFRKWLEQG